MRLSDRRREYEACTVRGHRPLTVLISNPIEFVCKYCGAHYSYDSFGELSEDNIPSAVHE